MADVYIAPPKVPKTILDYIAVHGNDKMSIINFFAFTYLICLWVVEIGFRGILSIKHKLYYSPFRVKFYNFGLF